MYEINLIRDKVVFPDEKKKYFGIFKLVFLGLIILFAYFIFVLMRASSEISKLRKERSFVELEISRAKENFKIEDFKMEWSGYYRKLMVIDRIMEDNLIKAKALEELGLVLPQGMCLTELRAKREARFMNVGILALEKDNAEFDAVKRFVEDLERSSLFGSGVKLESQDSIQLKNETVKLFRITIPLREKAPGADE
ncbi:MAG TPA: hypothetical protein VJC03_03760 [bacterium]|nr:hypothetical protein [bacterium]